MTQSKNIYSLILMAENIDFNEDMMKIHVTIDLNASFQDIDKKYESWTAYVSFISTTSTL